MTLSRTVYPNEIIVGAPGEDLESSDQDEAGWMYSYEIFNRRYVPLYGFGQSFVAKDNDGGDQFGFAMAVCHFSGGCDLRQSMAPHLERRGDPVARAGFARHGLGVA
jgi:hypothetical protein